MNLRVIFSKIKDSFMNVNKIFLSTLLFYAVYGLLLVIVGKLNFPITIFVPISEDGTNGYPQLFPTQIGIAPIFELLLNTPIIILFFYLIKNEIKKLETEKQITHNKLLNFLVLLITAICILGVGIHFTANLFNPKAPFPPSPTQMQILAYWLDELVGHFLIHIGIFGFFILMMIFEYSKRQEVMPRSETFGDIVWGVIVGFGFGFALAEGQCSFIFLIIYIITISSIFLLKRYKYPISLKSKRLTCFNISFYIGNIVFIVIFGIICVSMGFYFFSQPHIIFNIF